MRKNNIFIVAFMMLLALASASYAEKGKYSISELYHEYHGQRWQADYETVRNETICVDVEIAVPQADVIYVLSARYMPKGYEAANVKDGENIVNNQAGWFSCTWPNDAFWREAKKKGLQEVYADAASLVLQYGQFDMNTAYSVNNALTVQDALGQTQAIADRFFLWQSIQLVPHIVHAHVNPGEYRRGKTGDYELVKEVPDYKGVLFVMFDQCIDGVPVLDPDCDGSYSAWCIMRSMTDYGMNSYQYHMAYQLFSDFQSKKNDVKICAPSEIIKAAETMIQEGKLRSVYSLRLGYAAFSEGKGKVKLKPVWVIEGELFEKAKSEPKNIRTVLSVNSAEETKIIFDAQTGKLLETRRMSYQ
ncbi:MAG: hypothetical protein IJI45_16410 [Anaerolineaceae bacterium]|nr:hypothetical protein [Anaerolineaceae bacterium]